MDNDDLLQDFVVESNEHLEDIEAELIMLEEQGTELEVDLVNKVFRALHSIKGASGFLGLDGICKLSHSMENVLNCLRNNELVCSPEIIDPLLKASDVLKTMLQDVEASNDIDIQSFLTALDAIEGQKDTTGGGATTTETHAAPAAAPAQEVTTGATKSTSAPAESAPSKSAQAKASSTPASTPTATVRVSVSVLDHLMNLTGELVLGRNQLMQTLTTDDQTGLDLVGSRIDQITNELQEAIMGTRMQPVGNVFGRFSRVVRDLSQALKKQVTLSTKGDDVELDKTIIEAISDPLTHLVRNSVDHGIELPEERIAAGKNPEGSILLNAFHDGGTVNITITDDGAGINAEVLKEKALEKGLISPEQARDMAERDVLRLIFHPGFSTKEVVTDISGRGVGMDVVLTNLGRLGGTIEIDSKLGRGTTLAIKLPLTLAIIPALIVKSEKDSFALPQLNIQELVRVKQGDKNTRIERLKGAEVLRLRNRLLPLVRLQDALGKPENKGTDQTPGEGGTVEELEAAQERSQPLNVIVVAAGQMQYGLVVGDLRDSEEIVVKPLGKHVKAAPCFSGATILGDGHIALILDVAGIGTHQGLQARTSQEESERKAIEENVANSGDDALSQSVILFKNCPQEQFAVSSHAVSRIDRIKLSELVFVGGVEAVQGRDGILPVLRLENQIQCLPWEVTENAYVIVVDAGAREIGLLVASLIDIRSITTHVDTVTIRDVGVSGSVTLDGVETRVIDIYEMVDAAYPEWFSERECAPPVEVHGVMAYDSDHQLDLGLYTGVEAAGGVALAVDEPKVQESALSSSSAGTPAAVNAQPVSAASYVAGAPMVKPEGDSSNEGVLLVVEDSGFFRKKIVTYLRECNYEVVQCEDGLIGWQMLESGAHNIRLVVTDVEMPNMTGLELAAAIRGSQKHSHLPVIALSSLATDEDIARAHEVGVTDYQVKLDRNRLLDKIKELWNTSKRN